MDRPERPTTPPAAVAVPPPSGPRGPGATTPDATTPDATTPDHTTPDPTAVPPVPAASAAAATGPGTAHHDDPEEPPAPRAVEPVALADPIDEADARRTAKRDKRRSRLVMALVVLWSFAVLTSTVAVWVHGLVFDTDEWVATVGPLIDDEAVTEAVADALVDQVLAVTDLEGRVADLLPDQATILAVPVTDAVESWLEGVVTDALRSDPARTVWVEGNRIAHTLLVDVLRGKDTGRVQIDDGTVRLNLLPLLSRVLTFVDDRAPDLLDTDGPVPEITPDTPVPQAIDQLNAAFDRDLDDDFGQVVVFESDELSAAQDAATLFDQIVWGLVAVTVLMGGSAIALSRRRRSTVLRVAAGAVVAMALGTAVIRLIQEQVVSLITDPENRSAVETLLAKLVGNFQNISRVIFVVGSIVVLAAFFSGPNPLAARARDAATGLSSSGRTRAWVRANERELRALPLAAGVAAAVLVGLSFWWLVLIAVVVVGWEAALWILCRGADDAGHAAPGGAGVAAGTTATPDGDR